MVPVGSVNKFLLSEKLKFSGPSGVMVGRGYGRQIKSRCFGVFADALANPLFV
jgi:hypothetical protein